MDNRDADDEFEAITSGQEMSRMARLMTGELSVEDLDDEELYRGQCRDRNGNFTGGKRDMIPRAMVVEWSRRIRSGAINRLDGNLIKMTDALIELATSPSTDDGTRLAAIKYGMDRVLGRATERVELTAEVKPWEALMGPVGGIFRQIPNEEPAAIEAEIVEDR